jgi:hypothetical protein
MSQPVYTITNDGSGAYIINNTITSVSNGPITVFKNRSYTFNINASGHPFQIQTVPGAYSPGNIYSTGITGLGTQVGTITWTVDSNTPSTLYYVCQFHPSMNGIIYVINEPVVCFLEGTKILTDIGYLPIQTLKKGSLIKTLNNDYLPIDTISYCDIDNNICEDRNKDKLYVCSNKEYPSVFEDLVITGCHSILVDELTEYERAQSLNILGDIFVTDNKYRLPSCIDKKAYPYEKEGTFRIYHFALVNDDYYMNYGIYANGLLVETASRRFLKEIANMKEI